MEFLFTISRMSDDTIRISFVDSASHLPVLEVAIDPADFGNAVTGLARLPSKVTNIVPSEKMQYVGMKREIVQQECPKVSVSKDDQRTAVEASFERAGNGSGWFILDDGTRSQQNGKHHRYTIARYVPTNENT